MVENIRHKGLALLVLAGAQFMVILDATIVNVALPSIQKALGFTSTSQLQWIVTAYTLLFGGFLLLGGRLADLIGRRKVFLLGIALFSLASLLAGLAQSPAQIIAFRGLQGLGAAMLSPSALSLVLNIFHEGSDRNRALGVWSGVAAGGGAVGLLLGGILTQYVDWRWIFFINVPVGAVLAVLAFRFVPAIKPEHGGSLDVSGAFLVTAGLMSLVYGLVHAGTSSWSDGTTIFFLLLSVALLAGFLENELSVRHPLMRLSIFRNRNVTAANLMQLPITAGMFSVFFYLSIYEQQVLGWSPVKAGLANVPFTIFIAITAGITSRQVARIAPKFILVFSPLISCLGLFYFSRIPVHGHYLTDILPGIVLMATGMGATFVAITLAATGGVPAREAGLVSGILNTSQQIGGAIGLAVLTTVSASVTKNSVADGLRSLGTASPTTAQTGLVTVNALVDGFDAAFRIAGLLFVAASLIALIGLTSRSMSRKDEQHEIEHEAESFPAVPGI
jgi:EmrB/QacA subfamily drug resistance transporter